MMELPLLAEIVIEGVVSLPAPRGSQAAAARYQQKSGSVTAPEPPTAIVYLEGSFAKAASATNHLQVVQEQFQFSPALLPVLKGTSVAFPNKDEDYHHVFSYSRPKEFDLGRYRKDEKPPVVVFDKPGTVKVGCEIHDHMRAIILVLDTPYFAKTDPDGNFSLVIPDPLSGTFTLKAWVTDRDVREQKIELKDGAKLKVTLPGK